jgi:hypothetical protein
MPRQSKGARLWLEPEERDATGKLERHASWVIRDGAQKIRTGCAKGDRKGAEQKDPHRNYDAGSSAASRANYAIRQKKPFWDLQLDYRPGSKVFGWHLFPNDAGLKSSGPLVSGEGTKTEAASQICSVASGRGAIRKN